MDLGEAGLDELVEMERRHRAGDVEAVGGDLAAQLVMLDEQSVHGSGDGMAEPRDAANSFVERFSFHAHILRHNRVDERARPF